MCTLYLILFKKKKWLVVINKTNLDIFYFDQTCITY